MTTERAMSGDRVGKVLAGITKWEGEPFTKVWDGKRTLVPLTEVSTFIDLIDGRLERLGPLLRAGQAMRDHIDSLSYEDENEPHNCSGCGDSIQVWDAALAALERER